MINTRFKNLTPSKHATQLIEDNLAQISARFNIEILESSATLLKEGMCFSMSLSVALVDGQAIFVEGDHHKLLGAIDRVCMKLSRILRERKAQYRANNRDAKRNPLKRRTPATAEGEPTDSVDAQDILDYEKSRRYA